MGRVEKEIPEEILQQAEANPEQQEEIAKEIGVSKKTLKNRIKKVNLQTSFIADTGDAQTTNDIDSIQTEEKVTLAPDQYDAVAMSAIMLMDGMGLMVKNVGNALLKAKGKEIEYDVLSETEKKFMVTQLKSQPEALNYLAQNDMMMPLLAFGSILATFVMHFKIKDKKDDKKPTKPEPIKSKDEKIAEKSIDEKLKDVKLKIKTQELNTINTHPDVRKDDVGFLDE